MKKTKTKADQLLATKIIGTQPLDFARYEDGSLVIIYPDGRKLVLSSSSVEKYKAGAPAHSVRSLGAPPSAAGVKPQPAPAHKRSHHKK